MLRKDADTTEILSTHGYSRAGAHQIECIGFIALAQEQNARAAQALRERTHTPMTPDEQAYYDDQIQRLRATIDPPSFEATWSQGRELSMDDAIALATASEFAVT